MTASSRLPTFPSPLFRILLKTNAARTMAPSPSKIRIVCISDTHNAAPGEGYTLPQGDVLIHAGDLTNQGSLAELKKAVHWIEKADFGVKIIVAGKSCRCTVFHLWSRGDNDAEADAEM